MSTEGIRKHRQEIRQDAIRAHMTTGFEYDCEPLSTQCQVSEQLLPSPENEELIAETLRLLNKMTGDEIVATLRKLGRLP